jgi:hypothetical protein
LMIRKSTGENRVSASWDEHFCSDEWPVEC